MQRRINRLLPRAGRPGSRVERRVAVRRQHSVDSAEDRRIDDTSCAGERAIGNGAAAFPGRQGEAGV